MQITDLNPHGAIGANCLLARIGPFNVVVDCGLHPKRLGLDALPALSRLDGVEIDLVVLTHCHLDHLGALPLLAARHPEATLVTSVPNLTLAPRMLRNSVNVMKRQREEHGIVEYPFFTHRDVALLAHRLEAQRFERPEIYAKGREEIELTLHPAGHVAGAAAVELVHKHRRIVFSGDILFDAQRTLPGAHLPRGKIDTLVLETTRGNKSRPPGTSRASETDRLLDTVRAILDRGGSCLIPVFALGRTQEILKILQEARAFGRLPRCPVYAAGLGMDLCNVFDKIRQQTQLIDFDLRVLERLKVKPPDRQTIPGRDLPHKGLYVMSSGMLVERTPSYNATASLLPHAKNGLCFVGYCDPDSPGGKLLAARNEKHFFFDALDYRAPIRASLHQFDLSGHADREELADYATQSEARAVVLTHGDHEARVWFADTLGERLPGTKVIDPDPLQTYEV